MKTAGTPTAALLLNEKQRAHFGDWTFQLRETAIRYLSEGPAAVDYPGFYVQYREFRDFLSRSGMAPVGLPFPSLLPPFFIPTQGLYWFVFFLLLIGGPFAFLLLFWLLPLLLLLALLPPVLRMINRARMGSAVLAFDHLLEKLRTT